MKMNMFRAASFVSLLVSSILSSASLAQGTITFDPDPPVAGKPSRLIYDAKGGPLAGASSVVMHYGINKWTTVVTPDPPMVQTEPGKWEYELRLPDNATSVDFVFYDGQNLWDNNGGADWHVNMAEATPTVSVSPNPPLPGQPVSIRYNPVGTPLAASDKVFLHIGYNNWTNVTAPNPELKKGAGGVFECTIPTGTDVTTLNFCFTDGAELWDNNGEQNWTISMGGASAPAAVAAGDRVTVEPNPLVRGKEATITYHSNGTALQNQVPVFIQLGYDGWKDAEGPDPAMRAVAGEPGTWRHSFIVWDSAKNVEISFSDGDEVWDNNNKADWRFETSGPAGAPAVK